MMIVPALLTVAISSADAGASETPTWEGFTAEVGIMILEGRELPRDYRHRLSQMSPADRLQAIIYLRRSGLLKGDNWSVEDILRPPVGHRSGEADE